MKRYGINEVIKLANEEYAINGETPKFKEYENMVLASGKAKYIYKFARDVKGCHIKTFEDELVKVAGDNDAKYVFFFAADIRVADPYKLANKFITLKGHRVWDKNFMFFVEEGPEAMRWAEINLEKQREREEESELKK